MTEASERLAGLSAEEKRELLARKLRERSSAASPIAPLSHGQRALWFLHRLAPESSAYNVIFAARVKSNLDIESLRRAFQALLNRHASLRTTFPAQGGEPVQLIHEDRLAHFEHTDCSSWSAEAVETAILEATKRPFDLTDGPVARAHVFTGPGPESHLVIAAHHIAIDGWSLWICLDELKALYAAEFNNTSSSLDTIRRQPTDYVRWQGQMLASEEGRRHRDFWIERLSGEIPTLNLPTDKPRPPVQTHAGASHRFELDPASSARLRQLARQEGATPFMLLLGVFQTLLYRYTGQEDILVGSLTSGRSRSEFENLIGYLANPVVLRAALSAQMSFREVLHRARATAFDAFDHQDYPFPLLVEELRPERDPSRSPLFQVMFAFEKPQRLQQEGAAAFILGDPRKKLRFGELELETLPVSAQQEGQFDLTLVAVEVDGGLSLAFDYNMDLFEPGTITRMSGHLLTLIQGVLDDPDRPICRLPLLTPGERQRQLIDWNATHKNYPLEKRIHELFSEHVLRTPDGLAATFEDSQLTYRELDLRSNQLASYLRRLGVANEIPVGICVDKSLDMVVAILGVLKAGGAFVPLDPGYPEERLAYMVRDSRVPVLLSQHHLQAKLPPYDGHVVWLDRQWKELAEESPKPLSVPGTPEDLSYVIYTSGSTGTPKGVLVEHRGLVNVSAEQKRLFGVGPGWKMLQFASLSFDAAVFEVVMALGSGATLHLAAKETMLPGAALVDLLRDQAIDIVTLPPSALLDSPAQPLPHLKTITVAGEACPAELVEHWAQGRQFFNLYGPTETTIWATATRCVDGSRTPPIGRPIANMRAYVVDANLEPVPVGVPGELLIGGVGVARGYLNQPELTATKFIADPFGGDPAARLYRTGDLVRYTETGDLEFLGRLDYQVKVRGFRIELGEIEAALAEVPGVRDAVVLAREDAPGERTLVAYLATRPEELPSLVTLREFLKARLPDYMLPSAFVPLATFPLTPSGKIDRKSLPAPGEAETLEDTYMAPRSDPERIITEIWKEVLKLEKVGVHNNFFDLGGNSLLMARVNARLVEKFGREIAIIEMFQYPTISALAAHLGEPSGGEPPPDTLDDRARGLAAGRERLRQQRGRRNRGTRSE